LSYKKIDNNYFGFCYTSISNLYKDSPEFFDNLLLLITCLDSDISLSNKEMLLDLFDKINCKYKIINKSIHVDSENANLVLGNNKILTHFDEIYLLDEDIMKEQIITGAYTTDGYDFGKEVPVEFINLFTSIGAKRYVSDGCGLNFVCESEAIASNLVQKFK